MSRCKFPVRAVADVDQFPSASKLTVLPLRSPHIAVLAFMILQAVPSLAQEKAKPPARPKGPWLYIADADGSNMKLLVDLPNYPYQGSPCWSGDGKLIAFDALNTESAPKEDFENSQLFVVNADGSNPRPLIDGMMPSFSPGGKRIAFSRQYPNRGVWVMSVEGPDKELVLLDESGWGADWSPDGKEIVFAAPTTGGANFAVFNLVEGERRYLFPEDQSPYRSVHFNFAWSPDSKRIVFKGLDTNGKKVVGIVDARGSKHGLVTRLEEDVFANFSWNRDSGQVLLVKNSPERKLPQIFSLDPNGSGPPELLANQNAQFANVASAVSPDGKKLIISSRLPPSEKGTAAK